MRTIRLTPFAFALFFLLFSISIIAVPAASAGETDDVWEAGLPYFCRSDAPMQNKFYFSHNRQSEKTIFRQDVEKSFRAFLAVNYGYPNTAGVSCAAGHQGQAAMDTHRQQTIDNLHSAHFDVVETDWTYTPSAKAPVAGAPRAPSPVNPTASPGVYGFCWASMGGYEYFSTSFAGTADTNRSWVYAFADYLKQKYDYKGFAKCQTTSSLGEAQTQLKNMVNSARGISYAKVFETGWVYTAAASPPASPTPAASAAPARPANNVPATPVPSTHAPVSTPQSASGQPAPAAAATAAKVTQAVCWADFDQHTMYYSAVFDGTHGDYNVWMPAFKQFLEQKYHYTGTVRCTKRPNPADAQKYWNDMVGAARDLTLGDGSKPRIVETGWEYK